MIFGAHVIVYSKDAEADRAFLRDVLGFQSVDAGHGWLIFALPPAEVAVHPAEENDRHELYLMCDDLNAEIAALRDKGVACSDVQEARWGSITKIRLPGGGEAGLYRPKHPTALPATTTDPMSNLIELWDQHTAHEFATRDTEATVATMVDDAYVNHIPTMTGGHGKEALRRFYSEDFIPSMPPDTNLTPVSRTVGADQLVDEMIFSFTHTQEMPWMLPGIAPTHKPVQIPLVAIVRFRDGKLAHEHIYWDQASVLKQIGLLPDAGLPVHGAETALKILGALEASARLSDGT